MKGVLEIGSLTDCSENVANISHRLSEAEHIVIERWKLFLLNSSIELIEFGDSICAYRLVSWL